VDRRAKIQEPGFAGRGGNKQPNKKKKEGGRGREHQKKATMKLTKGPLELDSFSEISMVKRVVGTLEFKAKEKKVDSTGGGERGGRDLDKYFGRKESEKNRIGAL